MSGRGKKITDEERQEIIDLYRRGMAMRQVARAVDRSYGAVNLVLHQQDQVKVNPRGGYRRPGPVQ